MLDAPEDTFILLDALEEDADELRRSKPLVCLEVGYVCVASVSHDKYLNSQQVWIWMR